MLICPHCGAFTGIVNNENFMGNHYPHHYHYHRNEYDSNHVGWGWILAVLALASVIASFSRVNLSHNKYHCSKCGHTWS